MASPTDVNQLYVSPGPHIATRKNTTITMLFVIIALLPIAINGVILFGVPALVTILVSVATTVVGELVFQLLTKQKIRIKDLSAVVTGLLLALTLPAKLPIWMTILGALFAIIVVKGFFGGIGANVFNPALAGRAFLLTSFPLAMGTFPRIGMYDGITGASILNDMKMGEFLGNPIIYKEFFFGHRAGAIGETSILLLLIAFVFLLITKIIDWRAPVTMVATTAIASFIEGTDPLIAIMSGGLLFGAIFMATDYTTAPVTKWGRVIFGCGAGLITFLIRRFGGFPEGVMYSILIMNILTPFLNKIITRKYGYKKEKGKAK